MVLATTQGKKYALAALRNRRRKQPKPVDNASLPAGSPMFFYCQSCGHCSDCLPEAYLGTPNKLCEECQALKDCGWLE